MKKAARGLGINVYYDHGISDKLYRNELYKLAFYDYVCVSGPLWKEKMIRLGLPTEKLLTVGYARLDLLFKKLSAKKQKPEKRVIWAPTHSNSISSYPELIPVLDQFPKEVKIIHALHPYDRPDMQTTMEELLTADAVISDTSSLIYEAWALGIPVVFPDWLVKERVYTYFNGSFEEKIYRESIGYHANNGSELISRTMFALEHGIDNKAVQLMEGIFPAKYRGYSGRLTAKKLMEIAYLHNGNFSRTSC